MNLIIEKLDIFAGVTIGYNNVIETKKIMNKIGQNYPVPKLDINYDAENAIAQITSQLVLTGLITKDNLHVTCYN